MTTTMSMSIIMTMIITITTMRAVMTTIMITMQMKCLPSWGRETPHKFTREQIEEILKAFCDTEEYGTVLRSKGMVPAPGWNLDLF